MSGAAIMATGTPVRDVAPSWRAHLTALGAVTLALLLVFRRDAEAVASIWWNASTYEHCLVVVPIVAWLVWQRRTVVERVTPRGWPPPLGWIALGSFGWLLGEAASVAAARDLGLAMMIQGAVMVLIGRGATAALMFPIFYALFLVPIGDALVPPLQTLTAQMCMALLHLVHVPAHLDGVFITTPDGWFKVAEACSGAKFLIAMIALGVLVAHLGFLSWRRRAAFLGLCVVVPVLANGVRAFVTIWIAQYTGAKSASGIDHVIYGWFFFGLVIALVLAASWRYFDRPADSAAVDAAAVEAQAAKQVRTLPPIPAVIASLAMALVGPAWAILVHSGESASIPAAAQLPAIPGWSQTPTLGVPWSPRFDGADRLLRGSYRDASGAQVELSIALYAYQGEGRELVGFGHGSVDPDGPWAWAASLPAPSGANAERIEAPGAISRTVVSRYVVGGIVTGSPARVKVETLEHHLLGGSQRATAVLVSAEDGRGGRAAIDRFLADAGPADALVNRVVSGR